MKKRHRIKSVLLLTTVLLSAALIQGCAIGTRRIALQYDAVVAEQAASSETVAVVKFEDARQEELFGEVRNAYGMKTGKVQADDQDVGAWVANALADELTHSGLNVRKFDDAAPPDISISISGTVLKAYVKMYMSYRTDVSVQVTMTRAGVPLLNREYTGKASGMAVMASSGSYEKQLKSALQDLMKQLVPHILEKLAE